MERRDSRHAGQGPERPSPAAVPSPRRRRRRHHRVSAPRSLEAFSTGKQGESNSFLAGRERETAEGHQRRTRQPSREARLSLNKKRRTKMGRGTGATVPSHPKLDSIVHWEQALSMLSLEWVQSSRKTAIWRRWPVAPGDAHASASAPCRPRVVSPPRPNPVR